MTSASLYIVVCSAKNRIRLRLRRLKEPRYLIGAIVGVAYFYVALVRPRARRAPRRGRSADAANAVVAAVAAAGPALAGMALLALAAVAWALPFESGLLEFSDAETDFLFSAPVPRRHLLAHRLLRSQLGILFGAAIVALASPASTGVLRLRVSIATWILFLTIRVYFTVVTLARTRADGEVRRAAVWGPVAILAAAIAVVIGSVSRALTTVSSGGIVATVSRVSAVAEHGLTSVLLWPFVALARPMFAGSGRAFAGDVAAALVVLAFTIAWMLHDDDAFQEATAQASARRTERVQARRAPAVRARVTGLRLAPEGRPETAFFWKNGVQTLRLTGITTIRIAFATTAIVVALTVMILNVLQLRGGAAVACAVAIGVAGFVAVLGPQVVRTDLRADLLHLELLKTWPVRSAAVIRGEMAWPASLLTLVGWAAVACAAAFSTAAFPRLAAIDRIAVAAAAVALMPAVIFAHYLVQNAAALLFPAWVPLGNQRARGVDAIGQRLILLAGVIVSVVLLLVPGVAAGAAIWFALQRWAGHAVLVPASLACSGVVLLEVIVSTELLAPLYERLDVLAVERAE